MNASRIMENATDVFLTPLGIMAAAAFIVGIRLWYLKARGRSYSPSEFMAGVMTLIQEGRAVLKLPGEDLGSNVRYATACVFTEITSLDEFRAKMAKRRTLTELNLETGRVYHDGVLLCVLGLSGKRFEASLSSIVLAERFRVTPPGSGFTFSHRPQEQDDDMLVHFEDGRLLYMTHFFPLDPKLYTNLEPAGLTLGACCGWGRELTALGVPVDRFL